MCPTFADYMQVIIALFIFEYRFKSTSLRRGNMLVMYRSLASDKHLSASVPNVLSTYGHTSGFISRTGVPFSISSPFT